jgi:anti-sigma factor RsiW
MSWFRSSASGCPETEVLKAYVDGEASPREVERVTAHLPGCARCAEEVRIMEKIGEGIGEMAAAAEPPAGLRQRILASVGDGAPTMRETSRPAPARSPWSFGWPGVAAVSTITLVVVAIMFPVFAKSREAARTSSTGAAQPAQGQVALGSPAAEMEQHARAPASPSVIPSPTRSHSDRRVYPDAQVQRKMKAAGEAYGATGIGPDDIEKYVRGDKGGDVGRRKVVQTADFTIRVKRTLEDAEKELTGRVTKDGGYVESSVLNTGETGERTAELAVRVPVEKFEATVSWLTSFGEVIHKNVRGEDVTGTWIDQRSEVRELRDAEGDLLRQYNQAKDPAARDQRRWELVQMRSRIRASEERMAATAKMAALSSLTVRLTQPAKNADGAGIMNDATGTLGAAVSWFLAAVRVPLSMLIWLVVFAPLWLPCVLVYRWARARY